MGALVFCVCMCVCSRGFSLPSEQELRYFQLQTCFVHQQQICSMQQQQTASFISCNCLRTFFLKQLMTLLPVSADGSTPCIGWWPYSLHQLMALLPVSADGPTPESGVLLLCIIIHIIIGPSARIADGPTPSISWWSYSRIESVIMYYNTYHNRAITTNSWWPYSLYQLMATLIVGILSLRWDGSNQGLGLALLSSSGLETRLVTGLVTGAINCTRPASVPIILISWWAYLYFYQSCLANEWRVFFVCNDSCDIWNCFITLNYNFSAIKDGI